MIARDTLQIAVVGDVDPDTLGKLLDKTFGGLQAKARLTPVADVVAAKAQGCAGIVLGRALLERRLDLGEALAC